ncbi:hypothetical protein EC844_13018 [Acinetobacter calcoaceticus]|uniref:Uncharacterized protein n=1 Tax=Acinetobacter calcoaceticus TaxID=471 RepID=A0A4V2QZH7_ACICA|nr:hypothetical protein EC844_13018 [Acinetobacter calcoaceticus]
MCLTSPLVFAQNKQDSRAINSFFWGKWCDGVEAFEIQKKSIVVYHGRGTVNVQVMSLKNNTNSLLEGKFKFNSGSDAAIVYRKFSLKNGVLTQYYDDCEAVESKRCHF